MTNNNNKELPGLSQKVTLFKSPLNDIGGGKSPQKCKMFPPFPSMFLGVVNIVISYMLATNT